MFFIILGIIFILYFLGIMIWGNHATSFCYIWVFLGIASFLFGIFIKRGLFDKIPQGLKKLFFAAAGIGVGIFILVEVMVISGFFVKEEAQLDYIIVLGAQLNDNGPSVVLRTRLDRAYDYLIESEDTIAIVSGGQGDDEPDSEAQGMYDYLSAKGISPDRILKEDQSTSTAENFDFSAKLLDKEHHSVGIVTNNFHMFRATHIAKGNGYKNVYEIAAPSDIFMLPNNMFREFLAIVKDFFKGNLTP